MKLRLVAPLVGAWIETDCYYVSNDDFVSHPSWVRGLKQRGQRPLPLKRSSHPSWVRGLKQKKTADEYEKKGRTPRGCVD